jgi:hypothetical protein
LDFVFKITEQILNQVLSITPIHDNKLETWLHLPLDDEERSLDIFATPLAEFGIEFVECNMSGREEDVFHIGIDPLKHRKVEELGALLVQLWHQFPILRHWGSLYYLTLRRATLPCCIVLMALLKSAFMG